MSGGGFARLRRLVVLATNGIGDLITASPMLQSFRRADADLEIICVVKHAGMEQVLRSTGVVNRYVHFNPVAADRAASIGLLRALWTTHPDALVAVTDVDVHKSALLALAARVRVRVGEVEPRHRFVRRLYTHTSLFDETRHRVHSNLALFRLLFDAPVVERTHFSISDGERALATAWLTAHGVSTGYVAIHPGCVASERHRRWPLERYVVVAEAIRERHGRRVVFLGGTDELDLMQELQARLPDAVSAIGELPLGATAAVIDAATLMIGNDSGLMHIAGALATPTVSLIAEHPPSRCYPFGSRNEVVTPTGALSFGTTTPPVQRIALEAVLGATDRALSTQT